MRAMASTAPSTTTTKTKSEAYMVRISLPRPNNTPRPLLPTVTASAAPTPNGARNEIVRGRWGITADTALRLARYLGTTPEFWLKLQVHYELRVARQPKL